MKKDVYIRDCITKSLLKLMEKKDFNEISITEITRTAGVSRMAYYRNYNQKEDILTEYMRMLFEEYVKQREKYGNDAYSRYLVGYEFFKENKDFVLALDKSNLSVIILNKLNEYMKDFYVPDESNIEATYRFYNIFGAIYNSSKVWIATGMKESPEELAKIFIDTFKMN